jgi:hypothetical protein
MQELKQVERIMTELGDLALELDALARAADRATVRRDDAMPGRTDRVADSRDHRRVERGAYQAEQQNEQTNGARLPIDGPGSTVGQESFSPVDIRPGDQQVPAD